MGRKPRIEYEDAVYHVIQRGNNKEHIFEKDNDKQYLLKLIEQSKQGLGFRLFGYVVMSNHYHLLMQTKQKPLNNIMHRINGNYGRYYNLKYQRSGHVFQGRYKAILVQDERYLLAVLRYIHRNPIEAGICETSDGYSYSSDGCYRENRSWLVDIDLILASLTENRVEAIKKYKELMAEEDDNDYEKPDIIGERLFTQRPWVRAHERKRLDEILIDTGMSLDQFKLIKSGSRRRDLTHYKKLYINMALEQKYTLKEIGGNIGLSDVAVYKLVKF